MNSSAAATRDEVTFSWNGKSLRARAGDTIATALWRNDVLVLGSSRKRHRPLGLSGTYLQGELVQVDGIPHVRASTCLVTEGLEVRQQNVWPSPHFNLLMLARMIPPGWLRGGFERSMLFPGGTRRFQWWERLLMWAAGEASVDAGTRGWDASIPRGALLEVDTAVVGGGPAGRSAANDATRRGQRTVLVSSSATPGIHAAEMGADLAELDPRVTVLTRHIAVGVYRNATLLLAVPTDASAPARVIAAPHLVLATGKRSCPPWVTGHDLPGVLDLHTGLDLARVLGAELGPVVAVGTGAEQALSAALRRHGVTVSASVSADELLRIRGRRRVSGVVLSRGFVRCRTVVHAGPWASDASLRFQAASSGTLRLTAGPLPSHVTVVGGAAQRDEPPALRADHDLNLAVCPCMDVTVGEIHDLVRGGEYEIEVLKRATGCGMGPCQGFPCWRLMRAVIRHAMPDTRETGGDDAPTSRPPRGGITVRQAAGLDGLVPLD
jgi:sarcosine oxidase subunit alpha